MGRTMLIRGGHVVDPASGVDGIADVYIEDGVIKEVSDLADLPCDEVFDARGLTVMPGFIDMHVHLRDPGETDKEDLASGMAAAAHGGVTSLLAMPNTRPPMDDPSAIAALMERAAALDGIRVYQSGAVTRGQEGRELTDIEAIAATGAPAFSEDGKSVLDPVLLKEGLKRIAGTGALFCDHCEDMSLRGSGVMNDDDAARRLGLPGISNSVEDVIAARDIVLAGETGARIHLCHSSTWGSYYIVKAARAAGIEVSAEICPHHFTLSTEDILSDDGNYKMNPPLRTRRDVEMLRQGLADGTFEVISTDHAPHRASDKEGGIGKSAFGIVGLETSAALTYTELVRSGIITLSDMVMKMSANPARILRVPGGSLAKGQAADIAVFDFNKEYVIDPGDFLSKGRNMPFAGRKVYGRAALVLARGKKVWEARV